MQSYIETFKNGDFETTVAVREGREEKILLIHGVATTKEIWFLYPILFHKKYFVAYDQRGFGTGISKDKDYHFDRYVEDAEAIIKKYKPSLIVGHSFGGAVAQRVAYETNIPAIILESGAYPPKWVSGKEVAKAVQADIQTAIFESMLNYLFTPEAIFLALKFMSLNPLMPAMDHMSQLTDFKDLCTYDASGNILKIMGGLRDNIMSADNVKAIGKCANKQVIFKNVNHAGILYPSFVKDSLSV